MRTRILCLLVLSFAATAAGAVVRNVPSALYGSIAAAETASQPGDVINVAQGVYTENVTVDVNNLTIQGSCVNPGLVIVDGTNAIVFYVTSSNVTLKCLTTRNGNYGVRGDPGTGLQIQNVRVLSASYRGIYIENGDGFRIQAAEVRGIRGDGIEINAGDNGWIHGTTVRNVDDTCISLNDSSNTILTSNTLLQCGSEYGISIDGDDNQVLQNTITSTYDPAIYSSGQRTTVWKNTIKGGGWNDDAVIVDGDDATIDDNKVTYCSYDCIAVSGKRAKIRRNILHSFNDYCIDEAGDDALVSDNICTDSENGIYVNSNRARVEHNTSERVGFNAFELYGDDIKVLNNKAIDAGGVDAFFLECTDCDATEVRGNQAVRLQAVNSGYAGFYLGLGGAGAVITGNSALDGAGYGFYVDGSSATLSTNIALGNGTLDEAGFYLRGNSNTLTQNHSTENHGPGYEVFGDANILNTNSALRNLQEGIWVSAVAVDTRLSQNMVDGNAAEGIDNNGTATDLLFNVSQRNRRDCTNDGTFDQRIGNSCADGSNFNEASQVDN